jgi:amidase
MDGDAWPLYGSSMTNKSALPTRVDVQRDGDDDGLTRLPATEMARLVRSRTLDPVELVEATLRRIDALEPRLHAFVAVLTRSALDQAERLRDRSDLGTLPLAGVPVAVKDNIQIAGEPTSNGSRASSGAPAAADSTIVRRLREAGAVIIGRTVMPELAIWPFTEPEAFEAPRNPWNRDRTPGGSSGGSAVAVAARMAAVAVGSDGGGSIRVPAACCGIVGVKPAPGVVPVPGPNSEHWYGLTAFGPLARNVTDAALLLDVLADSHVYRDPVAAQGGLRIAVSTRHPVLGVRPSREIRDALSSTAASLAAAGHTVASADPRYPMLPSQFTSRWLAGIAQDATRLDTANVERRTAAMVRRGQRAQRKVRPASESQFATYIQRWLSRCDVLITPVLSSPPVPIGKWSGRGWISTMLGVGRWTYTSMWNVAGVAAIAVPAPVTADGLPPGVQLIGPAGSEPRLLSVAAQLEQANPWPMAPV